MRLSENQRGIVSMASGALIYIAATQIPATVPNADVIRSAIGIAGVVGLGLQKFLQDAPLSKSSVFDDIHPILDLFMQLTPVEQAALLTLLPKLGSLLTPPEQVKT